jgi:hypothetical protein
MNHRRQTGKATNYVRGFAGRKSEASKEQVAVFSAIQVSSTQRKVLISNALVQCLR